MVRCTLYGGWSQWEGLVTMVTNQALSSEPASAVGAYADGVFPRVGSSESESTFIRV